jgi:DNA primase
MKEQEITDEMIISARSYPVDRLIDFGRSKKAKAFCHEDKNPSMYHGTKINKAMCPVCNKAFDSIAILMKRDMMSFKDAVKQLSGV